MPAIPLGNQAYSRSGASQPETRLVNLFMEKDESGGSPDELMRLQRPGLTRIASLPSAIRGMYQSDNQVSNALLVVAGDQWLSLDGAPATLIATVPNDGDSVRMEATFERVGLLTAGEFYIWDGTTVTEVQKRDKEDADDPTLTLTDMEPIIDITTLNGYFILTTSSGLFYWLVPGETTVNPLAYADAESLPDGSVAGRRLHDNLFFLGSSSIEVWQSTGDADATFERAPGRLIERGCMSRDTVHALDNTLFWLGEDGLVYRLSDTPQRVSTSAVEDRIANRSDLPSAFVFTSYGHKFYVLRVPGQGTFAFDASTGGWSEFATNDAINWRPHVGLDTSGGSFCADSTGAVFRLDPNSPLDDGQPFLRLVTGTVALPVRPVATSSFSAGVGSEDPADFVLRWRDPRRDWSAPRTLTARGGSDILNAWRLGLARAPNREFELSTMSPTMVRISGAVANESWRNG